MSNLSSPADKPQVRRLNFRKPDPKRSAEEHDAEQAKKARELRAQKPEPFPFTPKQRPRLPDGARFETDYSATDFRWTGKLIVEGEIFEHQSNSVMMLLGKLDAIYRAWVAAGRPARRSDSSAV